MRGSWGLFLVLAGALVLAVGWLPELTVLDPLGPAVVTAPVDAEVDSRGRLVLADQAGRRQLVVTAEGTLESAGPRDPQRKGTSVPAAAGAGAEEAWLLGLEPAAFDRMARSPAGAEVWIDTWSGTVVWSPGPERLLREVRLLELPGTIRVSLMLWWAAAAAAAAVASSMGLGALWRWLRRPGTVAVRLAWVALPWAMVTGALSWWSLEENLGPRDQAVQEARLLQAGRAAVEGLELPPSRDWQIRLFQASDGALTPVPAGLPVEELKSALRTGMPQTVRRDGLLVLVPGARGTGESASLAAVRWTGPPRWLRLLNWTTGGTLFLWTGGSALLFVGLLWSLRRLRPSAPADPDRFLDENPWRAFAPRQWVELLGPDVLGPLSGAPPVIRSAVLVTWADTDPEWPKVLGSWGGLEVPGAPPWRRVLFPGGAAPAAAAAAAWTRDGKALPDLRVEVVRAAFGFVDTGFRQEPLVQGLPAPRPVAPGTWVDPALRRRWARLLSVANRPG